MMFKTMFLQRNLNHMQRSHTVSFTLFKFIFKAVCGNGIIEYPYEQCDPLYEENALLCNSEC